MKRQCSAFRRPSDRDNAEDALANLADVFAIDRPLETTRYSPDCIVQEYERDSVRDVMSRRHKARLFRACKEIVNLVSVVV
jgi:hypothetical protein